MNQLISYLAASLAMRVVLEDVINRTHRKRCG
jgi:hypothetical protein